MSKRMIFMLMALAMLAGFMGSTLGSQMVQAKTGARKVVKAQEFRLTDQRGITRASIDLTKKGDIYIALYDAKGKTSEAMLVTPKLIRASRKTVATVKKLEGVFSGILPGK